MSAGLLFVLLSRTSTALTGCMLPSCPDYVLLPYNLLMLATFQQQTSNFTMLRLDLLYNNTKHHSGKNWGNFIYKHKIMYNVFGKFYSIPKGLDCPKDRVPTNEEGEGHVGVEICFLFVWGICISGFQRCQQWNIFCFVALMCHKHIMFAIESAKKV